jgi:hypothetical protein
MKPQCGFGGGRELQRVVLSRHDHRDLGPHFALEGGARHQQFDGTAGRLVKHLADQEHELGREAVEPH